MGTHDVICWAGFAEGNLLPSVAQWVWPTLGIVQPNKNHVNDAKANLKEAFAFMNNVLAGQTFLVGERITYADITVALTLRSAYENVLTPEWRGEFSHVNRWFMTVINQPGVKSVVGDVKLCVKEVQFDAKKFAEVSGKGAKEPKKPKEPKKQEPKEKKEKKVVEKAPEPAKEEKPKDPWADCPKFTLDMDAWKRFFSNNDEDKSIEHFWTLMKLRKITPSGTATTNTPTNSPWTSWPPTWSEECSSVSKNCENTPSLPSPSVVSPAILTSPVSGFGEETAWPSNVRPTG